MPRDLLCIPDKLDLWCNAVANVCDSFEAGQKIRKIARTGRCTIRRGGLRQCNILSVHAICIVRSIDQVAVKWSVDQDQIYKYSY